MPSARMQKKKEIRWKFSGENAKISTFNEIDIKAIPVYRTTIKQRQFKDSLT